MNREELHEYLTRLTPAEREAMNSLERTGKRPSQAGDYELVSIDTGASVHLASDSGTDGLRALLADGRHELVLHGERMFEQQSGLFHIRKNQRFFETLPHRHDFIELIYVYSGVCRQIVNGRELEMKAGDFCLLDFGCVHELLPAGRDDIIINFLFKPRFFVYKFYDALNTNDLFIGFFTEAMQTQTNRAKYMVFKKSDKQDAAATANDIICEYLDSDICSVELLVYMIEMLFVKLLRTYRDNQGLLPQNMALRRDVTRILGYIDEHIADVSIGDVAQSFGYSPSYASELIKSSMGKTFTELRLDSRLKKAAQMLATGNMPAAAVASAVGYSNVSYFYRAFGRKYGCTPMEYRAQNRRA